MAMVNEIGTAVAGVSPAPTSGALGMACRFCGERADHVFVDLGMSPLCESYLTLNPMCEPQLGRRGLYGAMGGAAESRRHEMALLWVLNLCDGDHSLLDVAERSSLSFDAVRNAAVLLEQHGLLQQVHAERADV